MLEGRELYPDMPGNEPCQLEVEIFGNGSILFLCHNYVGREAIRQIARLFPVIERGDGWVRVQGDNYAGENQHEYKNGSQSSYDRELQRR